MRHDNDQFALTLFLALLAAIGTTALRHNAQLYPLLVWADWLVLAGLFAALQRWDKQLWQKQLARPAEQRPRLMLGLQPQTAWLIAGLSCLPIVEQLIQRRFGLGDPWEVVGLCCLQVASLAMGLVAQTRVAAGTSVLLSSFQLLFVNFAFPVPLVMALMAFYTLTVLWWLMGNYWGRLQTQLASRTISQMPTRARVLLPVAGGISLVVLLVSFLAPQQALMVLNGFMPTTGGEQWGDQFAQSGIGNGEILTGAKDRADTVGPVDTDVYLSSQQPCLYDMISEVYGKPSNHDERRIDVTGENQTEHAHERLIEQSASREFRTQRQGRSRKVDLYERKSTALLFVAGQAPLHLRLETFSTFDGATWTRPDASDQQQPNSGVLKPAEFESYLRDNQTWIGIRETATVPYFTGLRRHEMQIINFDSVRIPSPAALQSWYVPLVDRPEFFGLTPDGGLYMPNRSRIPILTTFSLLSHQVNQWHLLQQDRSESVSNNVEELKLPAERNLEWRNLAQAWTADCRSDGERALRIESRLRESFSYVDRAVVPPEAASSIDHFLATGEGQDYLFASTAVMLLRELGIPSRLVSGLYADQRNFDPKSGQTIFWDDDVHTWLEFTLDGRTWLPLEPTPSFLLPPRELTFVQWAKLCLWKSLVWVGRNWILLAGLLAVLGVVWRLRGELMDLCGRASWPLVRWLPVDWQVSWCSVWVDWRLRFSGRKRPANRSYRQWVRLVDTSMEPETRIACEQVFGTLDAMRYDDRWQAQNADRSAIASACHQIFQRFGPACKARLSGPLFH